MIINGSFETNSASGTIYNLNNATFNGVVNNATAFGSAQEIDLITVGGLGLSPQHGSWKLALHRQVPGANDAFSFNLSSGIVMNQQYRLSYYSYGYVPGNLNVGYSSNPLSFGTLIATSNEPNGPWTNHTYDFVATSNASYITVEAGSISDGWIHVDNFSLEAVPEPVSVVVLGLGALSVLARRRNR
jgi:hypothetical protein